MHQHSSVHIFLPNVGHHFDADCWCEPAPIYWRKDENGVPVMIVEHNDETPIHHAIMLVQRQATVNLIEDTSSDSPWVTRVLDNPTDPPSTENIMVPAKPKETP